MEVRGEGVVSVNGAFTVFRKNANLGVDGVLHSFCSG